MKDVYDSPLTFITDQISVAIAKQTDDQVVKAVGRLGIDVDKDKLFQALEQDKKRYAEAYRKGFMDARKHGYWIRYDFPNDMRCSVCGMIWGDVNREADFCPNCGAIMLKEEEFENA